MSTLVKAIPISCLAALVALACSGDGVSEPEWNDVSPILAANCVRCHGVPAIGGAPDTFRLDVWGDTTTADGVRVFGAGTMSEFIAARTATGEMPPRDLELRGRQMDTLENWGEKRERGQAAPPGDVGDDNRAPSARLLEDPGPLSGSTAGLSIEISDPENDLVSGELALRGDDGDLQVAVGLRNGRQRVSIDAGALPPGAYRAIALVRDHPLRTVGIDMGSVTIEGDGNLAPRVSIVSPARHGALFSDRDSPVTVLVSVEDGDPGDSHTLTLEAVRGSERIIVADSIPVPPGETPVSWDTTEVAAGDNWSLVATVSDGDSQRQDTTSEITVTHGSTDLTWNDVSTLFIATCRPCHPGGSPPRIPGLTHDFSSYESDGAVSGVYDLRGQIYRRVIRQANMPPRSAVDVIDAFEELDPEDRALLQEWLEGGAPP